MWLACYTQKEIAEAVGLPQQTVADKVADLPNIDKCQKSVKTLALHEDEKFEKVRQIYSIWWDVADGSEICRPT